MIIYLTSDFEPREKNIFFLLGCLGEILIPLETMFFGDKKLGILFSGKSEILNPFPAMFLGGSEILNLLLCSLGDQKL